MGSIDFRRTARGKASRCRASHLSRARSKPSIVRPPAWAEGGQIALVPPWARCMRAISRSCDLHGQSAPPGRGFDLRQSDSVRAARGLRELSPDVRAPTSPALRALGVDLVWAPTAEVMYPPGFATRVTPDGPATAGLEDKFRPHFFGGVATVVTQTVHPGAPAHRRVRGEGLSAAQGRDADGAPISICRVESRRRSDHARAGRARPLLAQRLSLGRRAGAALRPCTASYANVRRGLWTASRSRR